jgi:hypothetical protein
MLRPINEGVTPPRAGLISSRRILVGWAVAGSRAKTEDVAAAENRRCGPIQLASTFPHLLVTDQSGPSLRAGRTLVDSAYSLGYSEETDPADLIVVSPQV